MTPTLQIGNYRPSHEKEWQRNDAEGSFRAKLYLVEGLVEVFSYRGGKYGPAFTTFEMWMDPLVYTARLPRHYSERWIKRLARQFAAQCQCHHDGMGLE